MSPASPDIPRVYNNRNVYILGAGFSRPRGMPLIYDFLAKMREALEYFAAMNRDREVHSIARVLNFRKEAANAAYRINLDIDNIEQLFSLAVSMNSSILESLKNSIAATLEYCRAQNDETQYDTYKYRANRKPSILENVVPDKEIIFSGGDQGHVYKVNSTDRSILGMLAEVEAENNIIISFNYDLMVERCLERFAIPYNYRLSNVSLSDDCKATRTDGISLIKLHGSVNWAQTGTQGPALTIFSDYESAAVSENRLVLIPPTWQKVNDGALAQAWKAARDAIQSATRIVIVGFSMPETDIHFPYLLAAGLSENISLQGVHFINPTPQEQMLSQLQKVFQLKTREQILHYHPDYCENFFPAAATKINRHFPMS